MRHLAPLRAFVIAAWPALRLSGPLLPATATTWGAGLRMSLAVAAVVTFVGLTWVRAESLAAMMPGAVNLGPGVVTGLLGNSLGYWVEALGVGAGRACVVSTGNQLRSS